MSDAAGQLVDAMEEIGAREPQLCGSVVGGRPVAAQQIDEQPGGGLPFLKAPQRIDDQMRGSQLIEGRPDLVRRPQVDGRVLERIEVGPRTVEPGTDPLSARPEEVGSVEGGGEDRVRRRVSPEPVRGLLEARPFVVQPGQERRTEGAGLPGHVGGQPGRGERGEQERGNPRCRPAQAACQTRAEPREIRFVAPVHLLGQPSPREKGGERDERGEGDGVTGR